MKQSSAQLSAQYLLDQSIFELLEEKKITHHQPLSDYDSYVKERLTEKALTTLFSLPHSSPPISKDQQKKLVSMVNDESCSLEELEKSFIAFYQAKSQNPSLDPAFFQGPHFKAFIAYENKRLLALLQGAGHPSSSVAQEALYQKSLPILKQKAQWLFSQQKLKSPARHALSINEPPLATMISGR